MIGQAIAHYRVLGSLGAGGMGEVYRATDTKLGRDVAVKVLPEAFATDRERMGRFEREAQLLAALNHPNIAAVYGLEESAGKRALVMELVEGPTLADRLTAGPLPLEEALPLARQIAEALEYAHDRSVIHRDLKPANIKITPAGQVKVLDFGLAKALEGESLAQDISASPTLTMAATRAGIILGTAAYMSPEQAKGKPVDRRADVWAFGAVVYEMLVGRPLYAGETPTEILAQVITQEPRWEALPALPAPVRRLLERCLTKDPRRRLRDVGEARIAMEDYLANPAAAEAPRAVEKAPALPAWRRALPWAVAGALGIAAVALGILSARLASRPQPAVHAMIPPPKGVGFHLVTTGPGPVSVSPDGRMLAFVVLGEDRVPRLYLRRLDAREATPMAGTEGAAYPFWSPDSGSLGFFAGGKLKKVDVAGGPPITLCDAPNGKGGTWNRDGVIVFAPAHDSPLHRVSAAGGASEPVTKLNKERRENSHRHPRFLPDGRRFLYFARSEGGEGSSAVMIGSLDGKEEKVLMQAGSAAEYALGHLLFLRERTLMARPFDPGRLEFTGEPQPVAEEVMVLGAGAGAGVFSVSEAGVLAYQPGVALESQELAWVERDGVRKEALGDKALYQQVSVSPDGQKAAVTISDQRTGTWDIWVYEIKRNLRTRFTFDPRVDLQPVWAPDSNTIVFAASVNSRYQLFWKKLSGAGAEELLLETPEDKYPASFSPDGKYLTYVTFKGTSGDLDIWALPLEGERKPFPLVQTEFLEGGSMVSPDGKWLAYASNASGRWEVYVTSFPKPGRNWQVSQSGGNWPSWRRDGRELLFQAPDGRMTAVGFTARGEEVEIGAPRALLELPLITHPYVPWAPTPDHQRFLVIAGTSSQPRDPMHLVLNWTAKLKK